MSTGRVLWLIWCLLWAGVWSVDGIRNIPRTVCDPTGLVCLHAGNWVAVAVCAALVQLAVGAFWLPVGRGKD